MRHHQIKRLGLAQFGADNGVIELHAGRVRRRDDQNRQLVKRQRFAPIAPDTLVPPAAKASHAPHGFTAVHIQRAVGIADISARAAAFVSGFKRSALFHTHRADEIFNLNNRRAARLHRCRQRQNHDRHIDPHLFECCYRSARVVPPRRRRISMLADQTPPQHCDKLNFSPCRAGRQPPLKAL